MTAEDAGAAPILVTGAAGFIGYHLADRLLAEGRPVLGVDNLNPYYDVALKEARLARLTGRPGFEFHRIDLADRESFAGLVEAHRPRRIVHLAAQPGVRYSLLNPHAYADANLVGFLNVLEACRAARVEHLVYASSSSVYGVSRKMPFSAGDRVDHPVSLYAATKKANELMAHAYSHLHGLPTTGLRFFTVYGPWGRPDMAVFLFTKAILEGTPIDVYADGELERDFTYIDDITEGVRRVIDHAPRPDPSWDGGNAARSWAPYAVHNIGNHRPLKVNRLIEVIEEATGRRAVRRSRPMQPGDVPATFADIDDLAEAVGFRASTPIEVGVSRFVAWYREHYGV